MLKINELKRLDLGIKGENESKTLNIDMSAWASLYPNATAEILHKRSGDNTKALTGATYDSETKILTWIPTDTDTFYEGFGVAEIRMVEGAVVKKTKDLIVTAVCPSVIDGSGTIIESTYQAFLNSVISTKQQAVEAKNAAETAQGLAEDAVDDAEAAADEAQAAATAAEAAAARMPYIDETTGNWMVWNAETGEYVDTEIHAQGPQGPQGEPGSVENVRATSIKMSSTDNTTVYDAIGARANKVNSATSGNFAGLDANGNLTDSGHKASDFLTSHQDISGKLDKTDFYTTEMPLSSSDSTKLSSKLSAMDSSTSDIRKGLSYVAKLTNGNWQLNSGQNAAIGDFISVNGKLGRATAAITGGSTNIVENTNWTKEDNDGALNVLADEIGTLNSKFVPFNTRNATNMPTNSDFNDYITSGTYLNGNTTNNQNKPSPSADNGYLIVVAPFSRCMQIWLGLNTGHIYIRYYNTSTWSQWREIY